jgi:hypothetical protein
VQQRAVEGIVRAEQQFRERVAPDVDRHPVAPDVDRPRAAPAAVKDWSRFLGL